LKFQDRAVEDAPAKKFFYAVFEEYALRGVPEELLPIGRFDRNASNIWLGLGKLVIAILLVMMHPGTQMIQIIETNTGLN